MQRVRNESSFKHTVCRVAPHTVAFIPPGAQSLQRHAGILSSPRLRELWYEDLQVMSGRIARMRRLLYDGLVAAGTPSPSGSWEHIITQIGMFAFTGLTVRIPRILLPNLQCVCLISVVLPATIQQHSVYHTNTNRRTWDSAHCRC